MPPNMWKNPKKSDKLGVLSPVPVDNCVDNVDFCITHAVNIHVEHTIYVRSCNKFSWIQPREDRELGQRAHGGCLKTEKPRRPRRCGSGQGSAVSSGLPPSAAAKRAGYGDRLPPLHAPQAALPPAFAAKYRSNSRDVDSKCDEGERIF